MFCLVQTLLILSLLINRTKRRQGETAARLIADISSKFVNLPASEVDREILDAQRRVCECLDLDISALWQWADDTPRYLQLTHLYRPLGGPPAPERFDSRETFPWCAKLLLEGKIVSVRSLDSLPREAARDREVWQYFGIKSNLTFPLSSGGPEILGALGFNTVRKERAWLARELHDDVTQRLARLAIDAGNVERGSAGASVTKIMREVREGLVRLSEDVHALSYRLHPSVLEDLGLAEALRAECERFTRQASIPVNLRLAEISESMPQHVALCLFRVAQEALRNVLRHAQAHTVELSLRSLDNGLQLGIRDDGAGFDPARQRDHPSLGLASMRERVALLGGELDLESAPGQGTTVVAWVPMVERMKAKG